MDKSNKLGIISLILGLISILSLVGYLFSGIAQVLKYQLKVSYLYFTVLIIFLLVCGIVGIITSIIQNKRFSNKISIFGLIISIFSSILWLVILIFMLSLPG